MFFGTMSLVGMSVYTQKGNKDYNLKNYFVYVLVHRTKPIFSQPITTTGVKGALSYLNGSFNLLLWIMKEYVDPLL